MAKAHVPTFTRADIKSLVMQADPKHTQHRPVVYPDIKNPAKRTEAPLQPGREYPWAQDI